MPDKWEPTESDIEWQKNLLDICKDGAIWGAAAGIYRIDKSRKTLVRTAPGVDEGTHDRIVIVLEKLGWKMEEGLWKEAVG